MTRKPTTTYALQNVSVEDFRPRAATQIALSEILAARIRMQCRDRMRRLALANAKKATVR